MARKATNYQNTDNGVIEKAETPSGGIVTFRPETPSVLGASKWVYRLTLENTSEENLIVPIFDGLGYVARKLGIPTVSNAVVVNGSDGEISLAQLKLIAQQSGMDIHHIQFTGTELQGGTVGSNAGAGTAGTGYTTIESGKVFRQGSFAAYFVEHPLTTPSPLPLNLDLDVSQDSFRTDVVNTTDDFRFQGQMWTGLVAQIPARTGVTLSMTVSAVARVLGMDKI